MAKAQMTKEDELVFIARIGSPFGVSGFCHIRGSSESASLLEVGRTLFFKKGNSFQKPLVLKESRIHSKKVQFLFEEYESREKVRSLVGGEIWLGKEELLPCDDGDYYYFELVDSSLLFEGEEIGRVVGLMEGGGRLFLEALPLSLAENENANENANENIKGDSKKIQKGKPQLIPFEEPFIGDVQREKKTIELKNRWLLEPVPEKE